MDVMPDISTYTPISISLEQFPEETMIYLINIEKKLKGEDFEYH